MPFDFHAAVRAPFRMQPGLRRLVSGTPQLTPLAPGARHQREKLAVLSAFPTLALQVQPGFDATPALHALAAQAATEHPQAFGWDGRRASALQLGAAVDGETVVQTQAGHFGLGDEIVRCLQPLPPVWRLAGLLSLAFAEDFAVVTADGLVPWLAVTLPSHWAPEDKLGQHFTAVHGPVADNRLILQAADALVALVTGAHGAADERWERFVWTVTGHPRLHAHPRHVDPQRWPADIAGQLPHGAWWRTERQTFIPVPGAGQAVFTIAVQCLPLAEAISAPAQAAALHDAIASMSPAVLAYRGLTDVREPLLAWLNRIH